MRKREYFDYLQDNVQAVAEIEEFAKGLAYEEFESDRKTINAVIRSLEVIGEATKKLPLSLKEKYPKLPWKSMAGMRDKLIHEYFGVDPEILWNVIRDDIPFIKPKIRQIIKECSREI